MKPDVNAQLGKLRALSQMHEARKAQNESPDESEGAGYYSFAKRDLYTSDTGKAPSTPRPEPKDKGWTP
jgi:hypothetical protein